MTAGGKNVAPAVLEDRIRAHPLVSQCMVVGDGRPFVAALVTLDPEAFPAWATRTASRSSRELNEDPDLRAEIQRRVDEANAAVSQAESIRRFAVLGRLDRGGRLAHPHPQAARTVVLGDSRGDRGPLPA